MQQSGFSVSFWRKVILLLVVLAIAVVARLPQLFSPNLLLDGDECIVGLMAKHLTEGKPVTLYFYGQKYGFAFFEALIGAISFKLFGIGVLQLKVAMLVLWLTSLVFFYLTAVKLLGLKRGFWLSLLFALFPAWALWSMKARGGYLTSFLLASILTYVFTNRKKELSAVGWLLTGAAVALIFYAQVFWLAGLVPIIAYFYLRYSRKLNAGWFIAGLLLTVAGFYFFGTYTSDAWHPQVIGHNEHWFEGLTKLADRLYVHLGGYYYLMYVFHTDVATRIVTIVWVSVFALFFIFWLYRALFFYNAKYVSKLSNFTLHQLGFSETVPLLLQKFKTAPPEHQSLLLSALIKNGFWNKPFYQPLLKSENRTLRRKTARFLFTISNPQASLFFSSVVLTVGYTLFLNSETYGPRYLLPLGGFMILWLGLEISNLVDLKLVSKRLVSLLLAILLVSGGFSFYNFRNYTLLQYQMPGEKPEPGNEAARLQEVFSYLRANNISTVFTSEGYLLQWFIHFYSHEQIACRAIPALDRYPAYVAQANSAYKAGKRLALVGYYYQNRYIDTLLTHPEKIKRVGYWYYVYLNPTPAELIKIGFYKQLGLPASETFIQEKMPAEAIKPE